MRGLCSRLHASNTYPSDALLYYVFITTVKPPAMGDGSDNALDEHLNA